MKVLRRVVSSLCVAAVISSSPARLGAENSLQTWVPPAELFETTGRASEAEVATDPSGAVHVFWAYGAPDSDEAGWGQSIYYAGLKDGDWSEPIDVLVSPGGRGARTPSAVADATGTLHVVWSGGDAIYYSQADVSDAGRAQGWSFPQPLSDAFSSLEPAIAAGGDGELYVVWTQAYAGLVFARSQDGGQSWSAPQTIFEADGGNELARWGQIAVDDAGRIHVVLTHSLNDSSGRYGRDDPNFLYYLSSPDRGVTWTEPLQVVPEEDFGEINLATFGSDTVHLVWNGRAGRQGRYHRWSRDGGQTWSAIDEVIAPAPANPIGDAGLAGFPALVTDATGALHMITTSGSGDYYLRWRDAGWTSPVLVSPGLDGLGVTGEDASLEQPAIALSEGNLLHVVFHDGFERIWYTGAATDAPHRPPAALPTPTRASTPTPAATATLAPTAAASRESTATPTPSSWSAPPGKASFAPILLAIVPAVLLVGVVVFLYGVGRRRQP